LKNLDTCATPLPEINGFIRDFQKIMPAAPTCFRFPARIILKNFAGWLAEQKAKDEHHTLLMYLKYRIEKKGPGSTIEIREIEQLLGKLSFVFIFDGLDDDITSRLMKTPLQVSIMAILVKSGGEPPRYKYDLFTEYYNIILKRERQKNICKILNENPEYIDHIHNQLGYTLQLAAEQSENPAAHISHDEFKSLVSDYLENLKFSKEEAGIKTGQILQAVMERLVFLDEVVEGRIGFNIRSLQEYFAANHYVRNQPDEIIRKRLEYMCKSAYWRNTFLFALGYIFVSLRGLFL
jgi:hypothetical protein